VPPKTQYPGVPLERHTLKPKHPKVNNDSFYRGVFVPTQNSEEPIFGAIPMNKTKIYRETIRLIKSLLTPKKWLACIIIILDNTLLYRKIPDALLLKSRFLYETGKKLDLVNPKSFNEKIQWRKLYDRNPLYTKLSDKYAVREYVAEKIGEKYLIPLLWAGEKFDDINFDELPNQFVIKCNHDCGSVVICKDKNTFDIKSARKKIQRCLNSNYYHRTTGREWQYKDIPPKIIIEKYMADESGVELKEYKFFCFGGTPKFIQVICDRFTTPRKKWYDTNWNFLPISLNFSIDFNTTINKPNNLQEMLTIAEQLSKNISFVRVDLYSKYDRIYCGELTLTPVGGFGKFDPPTYNKIFGDWWELPIAK
jgi:hypothetical protein